MSAHRDDVSQRHAPRPAADGWHRMPDIVAPYVSIEGGEAVALRPDRAWDGSRCTVLEIHRSAAIRVAVRPLQGAALGLLNLAEAEDCAHSNGEHAPLERIKAHALSRKIAEDMQWFRLDPRDARDADRNPYYGSPAHIAWSQATSLRCGGLLDPQWLRDFDPLGGTLSQGVEILPGGAYPFELSKMAFAHRADWDLGRFFNAGPLQGLYDSSVRQPELGFYGLSRNSPVAPALDALYTLTGHPDWNIEYIRPSLLQETVSVISERLPDERAANGGGMSDSSGGDASARDSSRIVSLDAGASMPPPRPIETGFGWPLPAPGLERIIESNASSALTAAAPTPPPSTRSM